VAEDLDESGDWQSGPRTQVLQEEIERGLGQLIDALKAERQRREEDSRKQQQDQQGQQGQNQASPKEALVPDDAELKLLAAMELDTVRCLNRLLELYPELADEAQTVDPRVLQDVQRLAERHERTTVLFKKFRERLGLPEPGQQ
jgi:hypothetical protein